MKLAVTLRHSPTSKRSKSSFEKEAYQSCCSVSKKSGVKSKIPGPPPTDVVSLDTHNFDQIALVCLITSYILVNRSFVLRIRIPLKMLL